MDDPEINAMSTVSAALNPLNAEERSRVLRWAADRFNVVKTGGKGENGADDANLTEVEIAGETAAYNYFAELFAAAQPKSNEDKALVAAYWVQIVQGQEKWASRLLNIELKNLGHAIPNITDALTSNIRKKPQRVIQLQKSGSAAQATKTYKVTHEGIVYVQGMVGHGS